MSVRCFALIVLLCVETGAAAAAARTYRCPEGSTPFDSLVHSYSIGVRRPPVFTCIYAVPNGTAVPPRPAELPVSPSELIVEGNTCGLSPIDDYAHAPDFGVHTCKGDRMRCTVTCE